MYIVEIFLDNSTNSRNEIRNMFHKRLEIFMVTEDSYVFMGNPAMSI
jgi:hypothetical protein